MPLIYGVDPNKPVSPKEVRSAIIACFEQAHAEVAKASLGELAQDFSQNGIQKFTKANIESIVRKSFKESGGDFESPTKDSIIKAMDLLAEFSKSFRSPEIIKKHYSEIMQLVNKLE